MRKNIYSECGFGQEMKSAVSHSDLANQQHLQRVTGRGVVCLVCGQEVGVV